METLWKGAVRLTGSVCLVALAACSSGGGGGTSLSTDPNNNTTANNTTSNNTTTTNNTTTGSNTSNSNTNNSDTSPTVSINAPQMGVAGFSGSGSSFTSSPPFTTLTLGGGAVKITSTSVTDASVGTVTTGISGTAPRGGTVLLTMNIPSLDLNNIVVRGDGTPVTLADGSTFNAAVTYMDYTLLGAWSYTPASGGQAYIGQLITGYVTAQNSVPTSGTATYTSSSSVIGSGVRGAYAVPSGTGTIQGGTLSGDVTLNANFANNSANGTFSNMVATPLGGTSTSWNDVSLSGNFTRSPGATTINGQTTTTGAPANAGTAGFSGAATGNFSAMFYGPNAQEIGGVWTLSESTNGGKAAFGTFGAHD